jgi:hypothetical protein
MKKLVVAFGLHFCSKQARKWIKFQPRHAHFSTSTPTVCSNIRVFDIGLSTPEQTIYWVIVFRDLWLEWSFVLKVINFMWQKVISTIMCIDCKDKTTHTINRSNFYKASTIYLLYTMKNRKTIIIDIYNVWLSIVFDVELCILSDKYLVGKL